VGIVALGNHRPRCSWGTFGGALLVVPVLNYAQVAPTGKPIAVANRGMNWGCSLCTSILQSLADLKKWLVTRCKRSSRPTSCGRRLDDAHSQLPVDIWNTYDRQSFCTLNLAWDLWGWTSKGGLFNIIAWLAKSGEHRVWDAPESELWSWRVRWICRNQVFWKQVYAAEITL